MFPLRNSAYNYSYFLYSVAAYPAFCNTSDGTYDADYVCRRELATLLTHIIEDTNADGYRIARWKQGLASLEDSYCKREASQGSNWS